eukprot:COSAG06_NODE_3138_length_5802_cov_15.311766_2_plen_450_part_00
MASRPNANPRQIAKHEDLGLAAAATTTTSRTGSRTQLLWRVKKTHLLQRLEAEMPPLLLLLLLLLSAAHPSSAPASAGGDAAAAALAALEDGTADLARRRFSRAAESFRLAADGASSVSGLSGLSTLVAAAEGLNAAGEVGLAAAAFEGALAELAGKRRKPSKPKKALLARASAANAAAVARATVGKAEKLAAIEAAAAVKGPAPPLPWFIWAANTLQHQLKDDAAAVAVFEQGVMNAAVPLPLHDPAFANRLRQLLRARAPGSAARRRLEEHLSQAHPSYMDALPPAGESHGDASRVQAGGVGDVWRVGDPRTGEPLFRYASGVRHEIELEGLSAPVSLEPLAASPTAFVVDGFASAEECEALIEVGRAELVPSMVTSSEVSAHRTSSSVEWLHHRLDVPVVRTILQRAAELSGVDGVEPADFELQVVHYAPSQQCVAAVPIALSDIV